MATIGYPVDFPEIRLPEEDGIPLESPWHHKSISLLIAVLAFLFRDRRDYYCGGDMFMYFSREQVRHHDFRGPDFFYVDGVDRFRPRGYWCVWEEDGKYPNMILELLSPSTADTDRTIKKRLYEKTFRTPDYFCYDPSSRCLEGWRLNQRQRYVKLKPNSKGWLWCEELKVWVGTWTGEFLGENGTWVRFYDEEGRLIPTVEEAERAEKEAERAEKEAALAEVARLKELLARRNGKSGTSGKA
jgi:Uma2 family endonuclease